jgi:hypothetical protein
LLLEPPPQPATQLGREKRHRAQTPIVFRAETQAGEPACPATAPETDPCFDDEVELDDGDDEPAEDELAESRDLSAWGRFWAGFREAPP